MPRRRFAQLPILGIATTLSLLAPARVTSADATRHEQNPGHKHGHGDAAPTLPAGPTFVWQRGGEFRNTEALLALLPDPAGADGVLGTDDDPRLYTTSGTPADRANPFRGGYTPLGGYRRFDPLDPRLGELKALLQSLGNTTLAPALTRSPASLLFDFTGDSFAGDFSGIVACIDPYTREAEEQRIGLVSQPDCFPNTEALLTGTPSPETRDQPLANVRIAFDGSLFGGGRSALRPGGTGELPMRPAPDLSNLLPADPGLPQGLYFPPLPDGLRFARNVDLLTGRPLVAGFEGQGDCLAPPLDLDGDGLIDTFPDGRSVVDSQAVQAYSIHGIGADPACLRPGGAPGFDNEDPVLGGVNDALHFHPADQGLFAWICSATLGSAADLDPGACALSVYGSLAPLAPGFVETPVGEIVSALLAGDPDTRLRNLARTLNNRMRPHFLPLQEFPVTGLNRDPGPADPDCPTEPGDFEPFAECARWDGSIAATSTGINRQAAVGTHTLLVTGELLSSVEQIRALVGTGPLPPGPPVDGMPSGVVTSTCTRQSGAFTVARRFPDFFGTANNEPLVLLFLPTLKPSQPGICMPDFRHDPDDLLTPDSALTSFQKALLGCGPDYGIRCDSAVGVGGIPQGAVAGSVDALNAAQGSLPEGGGLDLLNAETLALLGSWAPVGLLTLGPGPQPGTAPVRDPAGLLGGFEGRDPCRRRDAEGNPQRLPGCRGIESISVERDAAGVIVSIGMAFEDGYRPSVDGCLVGGGAQRVASGAIGNIGGVDVVLLPSADGYLPDRSEIEECHTESTRKLGDFEGASIEVNGSGWLWHPLAGCLGIERAAKVRSFGTNVDPDTGTSFGDCGEVDTSSGGRSRSFVDRFRDLDANGFPDVEDEFLGRLVRADGAPATAQLFRTELAALSWNLQAFHGLRSCREADESAAGIRTRPECFDPEQALRSDKCSFNAPGLCREVALLTGLSEIASAPVEIDVRPGMDRNAVNVVSNGLISVAVLGSEALDVADVDPTSLALGPGAAPALEHPKPHLEDVNRDGYTDLVTKHRLSETGVRSGDSQLCLRGEVDGASFEACDAIVTVPARGSGASHRTR